MWSFLWRSIDRFSPQHFKSVVTELRRIKVVDEQNRPKIDEDHPTWLHLRIRDFDPDFFKAKGNQSKVSNPPPDGRWTLGFHSAKACETAQLLILEETSKQRSSVESTLAPLLQEDYLGKNMDSRGD